MALLGAWGTPPVVAPGDFRAYAYELELTIDREKKAITGRETIRLRLDRTRVVRFPRNGLEVRSVTGPDVVGTQIGDELEIQLRPSRRETSIVVEYAAMAPRGIVFAADAIYSVFFTCHWMVCRDRPDDKATFRLSVSVPAGEVLVASGAPTAGGWVESVPTSPYLFGFALGKLPRIGRVHRGVALEYFGSFDEGWRERAFADDDKMLDFFVSKAGTPLPRPVYRQVVVDGDAAQEMSSFSVLGRKTLDARLADPTEDWLVAHELAHQFWGNLVTCAEWRHFWLNEGLTVFMVAAWKEHRWGRAAYEKELGLLRARRQAAVDAGFDVPLTFAGEYPSLRMKRAIVYSKGALFVARLREVMGERAFWAALRRYTRRFARGVATTEDFQRVFAAETDMDLRPLFASWVY
jgi:aminopeptidase N